MTDQKQTAFQRLVAEAKIDQMIDDLENLERMTPDDVPPEEIDGWEVALSFTRDDVPFMLEELRELRDDGE